VQQLTDLPQIEEERQRGPLVAWDELLAADPTGTLFQGQVWCLEWYRTYYGWSAHHRRALWSRAR